MKKFFQPFPFDILVVAIFSVQQNKNIPGLIFQKKKIIKFCQEALNFIQFHSPQQAKIFSSKLFKKKAKSLYCKFLTGK